MDYYLVAMERTRLSDLFPMKKGGPRGAWPLGLFVGLLGKYSCTGCLGRDIGAVAVGSVRSAGSTARPCRLGWCVAELPADRTLDRKSTRLNSSHRCISYAVFCLKKKKKRIYQKCIIDLNTTK